MIKLVRIIGESYDLETGGELPKGLVLSNGVQELTIHVDDAVVEQVVSMMSGNGAEPEPQAPTPQPVAAPQALELPDVDATAPSPQLVTQKVDLEAELAAAQATVEGESFEPGEEYDDPGTGAESW